MAPKKQLPALQSQLLLEGLVLGIALGLRGTKLTAATTHEISLRELLMQIAAEHTSFATLLRQLWRLGPETYVKRELARLRGDLPS